MARETVKKHLDKIFSGQRYCGYCSRMTLTIWDYHKLWGDPSKPMFSGIYSEHVCSRCLRVYGSRPPLSAGILKFERLG